MGRKTVGRKADILLEHLVEEEPGARQLIHHLQVLVARPDVVLLRLDAVQFLASSF